MSEHKNVESTRCPLIQFAVFFFFFFFFFLHHEEIAVQRL